jgi:predicted kinase
MLIILGGLPAVGKTAIARELGHQLGAVHLRIDSIEQAFREWAGPGAPVGDAGYRIGYAVAADNLRLGRTVVADSVNPLTVTRDAWVQVARREGAQFLEVEIVCSDVREHRRRVETRQADVPGLRPPSWQDVVDREYDAWTRERLVIDTARSSVEEAVARLRAGLAEPGGRRPGAGP